MRRLILLCGSPFSGKSTLAARLVEERGAASISFDAINHERGLRSGDGLPVAEWARTLAIAKERTAARLAEHALVVVDDTLCFRWIREEFREIARAATATPVLLHLDPPESVLGKRMVGNERITSAVLAEHLAAFERPAADEEPIVLRTAEEIEAWLASF